MADERTIKKASVASSISMQPVSLLYDIEYKTGLYFGYDDSVVVDLTVSYV